MAAKAGFKDLLLQKGEKFALIGALGLFGLFVVWGVVGAAGADNTEALVKGIDGKSNALQAKINNKDGKPEFALPKFALPSQTSNDFTMLAASDYRHLSKPFEPIELPSQRRDQPRVLTPVESQINYFAASYKAYDRKFTFNKETGEIEAIRVGVLTSAITKPANLAAINDFYKGINKPGSKSVTGPTRPKPAPTGTGAGPMGPGDGPMGPGAGPMGPPMGSGAGRPPIGIGSGEGLTGGNRSETKVSYMSIEEATKLNLPPAVAVYPIRMAVIQMSFPLREQLEEIKQALRLRSIWEARQESSPATIAARSGAVAPGTGAVPPQGLPGTPPFGSGAFGPGGTGAVGTAAVDTDVSPAFVGLVVERLTVPPEGLPANLTKEKYESLWEPRDHQERFFSRFTRYDAPFVKEEGYKPYFLRPEQGISAPLPVLADGFALNYPPDSSLGTIYANYKKLEDSKAQKKTVEDVRSRYKYSTNPYTAAPPAAPGGFNGFGDEDSRGFPMPGGSFGGFRQPPGGSFPGGLAPGADPEYPGAGTPGQGNQNKLDVDHLLMRFLDVDLVPGNVYQYRVKVLMKNPNFKNTAQLADNNNANVEVLESAWFELPQKLSVPQESFLFAYPVKKYEESVMKVYEDSGKADPIRKVAELQDVKDGKRVVIQMQQWMDRIMLGNKEEPIGSYVQAEMPVGVGEYVGKKVPVELPLWRSAALNYVLAQGDTKSPIYPNWPKDTQNSKHTLPKMRVIDFRTKSVLVDFEGGHSITKVPGATLNDDSMSDLLIVREDGKIEVRSEALDMAEDLQVPTQRSLRDKGWNDWLKRVRVIKDTEPVGGPNTGPGTGRPGDEGER